ncbi:isopentenyl-diphosphate Delta-isomerase [Wenzhouxiangella limi]|uniref:Isopentenyl-diphosphate Delta-isomerase n=1 Tax=Wenzhouxiangella limi TaxID=2707351 RepID=A0A845V790_9GAMM|nr:isopentenyl-diphosphate Delta-isomerase [Wenzhouxiangella limi]
MPDRAGPARIVSSDAEALIRVDENDNQLGILSKRECHDGDGVLHRAFSLFLFDQKGRLLMQQRSAEKRLWPLYWANSCCSHPRAGETMAEATERRLLDELGVRTPLHFIYKFRYQAGYEDLGSEHELCWVYVGRVEEFQLSPNPSELAAWRFVEPDDVDRLMNDPNKLLSPWFRMEWEALRGKYQAAVAEALS